MAKYNKEEAARREGMAYALKVAKEKGIEELERDIKLRGATKLPLAIPKDAIDECLEKIKMNTIDTVMILAAATLHDEFGFGQTRVQRFLDRFDFKADCILENYCTWKDQINQIKEDLNITLQIRENNEDVKVRE